MLHGPATRPCAAPAYAHLGVSPGPGDRRCGTRSRDVRGNCGAKAQGRLSPPHRRLGTRPGPRAADRAAERGPDATEAAAGTTRMLRFRGGCPGLLQAGVLPEWARPGRGVVQREATRTRLGAPPQLLETAGRPGALPDARRRTPPTNYCLARPLGHPIFGEETLVRFRERKVWALGRAVEWGEAGPQEPLLFLLSNGS